MARNRRRSNRDMPIRWIEGYLANKNAKRVPGLDMPMSIGSFGQDSPASITPTPQTGAGRAIMLNSQHSVYQGGFTYQGDINTNLAVAGTTPTPDGNLGLNFTGDLTGIQCVEPSTAFPHDNGQMSVRLYGKAGASGDDYEYVLSVSNYDTVGGAYVENLVVRWEPIAGELRMYPDITGEPTTYAYITMAVGVWQALEWDRLTVRWSYVEQLFEMEWYDPGTSITTPSAMSFEPVLPPWPLWDEGTKVNVFTDLNGLNSAHHEAYLLEFGQSMNFIDPGTGSDCCTLDQSYDAGQVIDYSTDQGPVELNATTAHDPSSWLQMYFDGQPAFVYNTTARVFRIYDNSGVQTISLHGNLGSVYFNESNKSTGGLVWYSEHNGATPTFECGAGTDSVNVIGGDFILGNSTTQGEIVFHDGDGESLRIHVVDAAASAELDLSDVAAWTNGYLCKLTNTGAGLWKLEKVDPASLDTDTDTAVYSAGIPGNGTTVTASQTALGYIVPVAKAGTIDYANVYINTWTPDLAFVDTITFTLFVNGFATDSWTDNSGTAGVKGSGASVSQAVAQGDYIQIQARVTTQVGALDTIRINSWTVNITYL